MQHLELDRQFHIRSREEDSYYHQYSRLYLANVVLTNQVKQLIEQKNQLQSRLNRYQDDDAYSSYDQNNPKNKRLRRTAHQIERFYKCSVKSCEKSYGSEGSLNQHYKLKHPEIYITLPSVQQSCFNHQYQNMEYNSLRNIPEEIKVQSYHPVLKESKTHNHIQFEDHDFQNTKTKRRQKQNKIEGGQNQIPSNPKKSRARR